MRMHDRCRMHWKGFTLIEIMVTVAIIALLASIAYPAYSDAVRKARRSEGRAALLQLMQQQERYYLLHTRYIAFSAGSDDADAKKFKWHSGESASASAYEISGTACAGETLQDCIVLVATPGSTKVDSAFDDPQCGALSLSSSGTKLPAAKDCW